MSSCRKCDTYCGADKPLDDIPWLRQIKETATNKTQIYKESYNYGREGFFIVSCADTNCNYPLSSLMTCTGDVLCSYGGVVGIICYDSIYQTTTKELIYSSY
ncbi:MAG: hypothetical protein V4615_09030 [Bacteroidota bacterium]